MSFRGSIPELIERNRSGLLGKHHTWERIRLLDVCTILNGYAFASSKFSQSQGIPLIRIRDINSTATETCYDGVYDDKYVIERNNLLIGMDGDFNAALWQGPRALLNQRVCKLIPNEQFMRHRFLAYTIPGFLREIHSATSAQTVKHLSSETISLIDLPLPPLNEQQRIVTKLDELFSDLDAATAALERVQANLKRYRASVLKSAVEGKLTAEWRAKNPPKETGAQLLERILKERRAKWAETQLAKFKAQGKEPPKDWQKKYSEPVKPDTTDLPELPEGWVWASFESIVQIISGNAFPSEAFTRQGVPVVKIANISYGEFIDKDQEYLPSAYLKPNVPYRIESQDLLLTLTRPITNGQVKVAFYPVDYPPALLNQRVAALRSYGRNSTERQLFDRYLMILLQSTLFTTFVRKNVNETLQPNLSPVKLAEWQIPLPPENEIRHLIEKTESLGIDLSRLMTDLPTHDKRGSNLRQAILKQAFEGKLVPQDPNDEPASELLKRIREERISEAANKTIRPELKQQKPKTKHVRSVKKSKSITNRKRA